MRRPVVFAAAPLLVGVTCAQDPDLSVGTDGPTTDLKAVATAHYEAYGQVLANARRNAIANFYHPDGH